MKRKGHLVEVELMVNSDVKEFLFSFSWKPLGRQGLMYTVM